MPRPNETEAVVQGAAIEVRSIALAIDCSTLNRVALQSAVELAAATGATLQAVFIEDECLHHLAAMPFAREVSFSGTRTRSFGAKLMRDELKRSADAARNSVSEAAARAHVKWGFAVTRGQIDEALKSVGRDAQILALGSSRSAIGRGHSVSSLRTRMQHGSGILIAPARAEFPGGPVVAVISPGADAASIVRSAESISRQARRPYRFLIVSGGAAERAALHQAVLEAQAASAETLFCDDEGLASVTRSVRLQRPGLVIGDIDYAHLDDAPSTERVAEAFGAPLILLQV